MRSQQKEQQRGPALKNHHGWNLWGGAHLCFFDFEIDFEEDAHCHFQGGGYSLQKMHLACIQGSAWKICRNGGYKFVDSALQ